MDQRHIGGFFGLEIDLPRLEQKQHSSALSLTTGRACLGYILQELKPTKVYLPYYVCDTLLSAIEDQDVGFEFYSLDDNLDPANNMDLKDDELLIYINYFGLKKQTVEHLGSQLGSQLVIDNTHSFFSGQYESQWSFTSARKFFGVPDGAYLYCPKILSHSYKIPDDNSKPALDFLVNRKIGKTGLAYKQFKKHEESLGTQVKGMSEITRWILSTVDYEDIQAKRIANFEYLKGELHTLNKLDIGMDWSSDSPFCYPLLLEKEVKRQGYYDKGYFIPTIWADTIVRIETGFAFEKQFSQQLLPLPVDHRYTPADLEPMVEFIKSENPPS